MNCWETQNMQENEGKKNVSADWLTSQIQPYHGLVRLESLRKRHRTFVSDFVTCLKIAREQINIEEQRWKYKSNICVWMTYESNVNLSTSCSFLEPLQSPLHRRLWCPYGTHLLMLTSCSSWESPQSPLHRSHRRRTLSNNKNKWNEWIEKKGYVERLCDLLCIFG